MQKRLLLALAFLSCSAPAFAGAARTSNDTVCVPHQDEDCDASSGSSTPTARATTALPSPTSTTMPRATQTQRRNRTDAMRNNTMRFQSYLPGMFR